jgi:hypothetical protein
MSFPANPYTGQTTIVNSVNYIYDATNNAWKRIPASVANLVVSNTVTATNLAVTGNATRSWITHGIFGHSYCLSISTLGKL